MQGYIYVLVNSSLPGLVKVGKTTRVPSERVEELSSATGVPTPFIVAFEKFFYDCDHAEALIHEMLEQQGCRPANNREFFRATASEVVNLIITIPDIPGITESPDDDLIFTERGDDLDEFSLSEAPHPWNGLLEEAFCYEMGLEGYIQDKSEAFRLYKQAARLGCAEAYVSLGNFYTDGDAVKRDDKKALEMFKEAVRRGHYLAYLSMAILFFGESHEENFHKCVHKMIEEHKSPKTDKRQNSQSYHFNLALYLNMCKLRNWEPRFWEEILIHHKEIILAVDTLAKTDEDLLHIKDWIESSINQ